MDAIDKEETIELRMDASMTTHMYYDKDRYNMPDPKKPYININPMEVREFRDNAKNYNSESSGPAIVFNHELNHWLKDIDDTDYPRLFKGATVRETNKTRRELGLETRKTYTILTRDGKAYIAFGFKTKLKLFLGIKLNPLKDKYTWFDAEKREILR